MNDNPAITDPIGTLRALPDPPAACDQASRENRSIRFNLHEAFFTHGSLSHLYLRLAPVRLISGLGQQFVDFLVGRLRKIFVPGPNAEKRLGSGGADHVLDLTLQ